MEKKRARGQTPGTGDARWAALDARDRRFDGAFVYAVRTTGIYCRPTCPSRRPHRANVEFFSAAADAERAGFRPCRRCRPHVAAGAPTDRSVDAARQYLDRHNDRPVTLSRLARAVGLSPAYLQRAFTRSMGVSPKAYHDALRRDRLRAELRSGEGVSRAAYEAGFGSSGPLYARRGGALGMPPAAYRRGGTGVRIRYTIVPCALGQLLVAATERGVCSVALGDTTEELESGLTREFPSAELERDDTSLRQWAQAIVRQIEGGADARAVPIDLQGTAFQIQVWNALREIPRGETRTYAALAATIGRPSAARAVARACATNRVAVVVPCHRVIPATGAPGGYRWGPDRKRDLLAAEHGATGRVPAPRRAATG
jgi:AraC family transcriptional regulator of adaptative response/methylated-DNA-[protein]-cysteine methyltransferase